MRQKVLITDSGLMMDEVVNNQQLTRLKSIADVVRKVPKSDEEMAEWVRDSDATIAGRFIAKLPNS